MRHDPFTGVFNGAYINGNVRFNVQDAFLESDISDDGLTRAFTYMSIRCNPGAPDTVPTALMDQLLAEDPEIVGLDRLFKESRLRLRGDYGTIRRAPKLKQEEHEELGKQLRNAMKSFRTEIDAANRKEYFYHLHNEMMKRQLQRHLDKTVIEEEREDPEPAVEHQLAERTRVQQLLCDLSKGLRPQEIVARKILAIDAMTALASRQEIQTRKPLQIPVHTDPIKKESPAPTPDPFPQLDEFPLRLGKTQCIFCIGNEQYSYDQRTRSFKRVSHMWDHVENVHLKYLDQLIPCDHPVCKAQGVVLNSVMLFKNHVARVHKVELRPTRAGIF
jgi:hypothetical protein